MLPTNDHVLEYLDAYLHEVLSPPEAEIVRRHCQSCRICALGLEEAQRRFQAVQALPTVEASEELIRATEQEIEAAARLRVTAARVSCVLAAAAAAILACVNIYYLTLTPSPYDLRVLGQTAWIADSDASLRVVLVRRDSGRAMEGVPVEIELARAEPRSVVHLASLTTDRFGTVRPQFRLPDWDDGQYELRVRASVGRKLELITRAVKLRRCWQLMLSSDKPVYQPGQTIRVRSLAVRRPELKPIAGHEVVFSVTDPKGNVILQQRDVTSRFGIASVDCPLASEILEGPYQVQCQVGDTRSSLTVEVRKYVLPKFKVAVELDEPYYQPGQRVRGTVQADYFFGKPVADADVQLDVQTSMVKPTSVHQATLRTDASGAASFEFTLPRTLIGREQDSGNARISLDVTVRDSGGQRQSLSVSRVVAAEAIHIEVIAEMGSLVAGVANRIYIFTSYPDGRPAKTRMAISGMDRELATNSLGVASLEFTPQPTDGRVPQPQGPEVRWTIRATDDEGQTGRREVTLMCGTPLQDFLVRTDKAVYDGGQTMHILALGGGVQPVLIDLIKDGQTILTDVIEMGGGPGSQGRGEYQFDLPPGLSGAIQLSAYRYDAAGLPVSKNCMVYVRPAGQLRIETTCDRREYRPGQRARLSFRLTDEAGRPAPGALSLAAVDEAVFSVLAQRTGLQPTFSALEQELLKPIYAIYPWSPDLDLAVPPKEQIEFEQALFARGAQRSTDRDAILRDIIERYGEGDFTVLDVLDRPDIDDLLELLTVSDKLKSLLRGAESLHSLRATSFPAKSAQIKAERSQALKAVKTAWIMFGAIGLFAILIVLVCVYRRALEILILAGTVVVLVSLMLPAVQSAREASRRASALNTLKEVDSAIWNAEANGMDLTVRHDTTPTSSPARMRQWFPETLLWRPELVTDDDGRATLEVDLADSITTWRLSASAIAADGRLGGGQEAIRVFQPFFVDLDLPVALTRGDEVTVPVVVYNYLDKPQAVELSLAGADWFELLGEPVQKLDLAAGEVRSVGYRLRARKVGRYELQVDARGSSVADAIKRQIEVVPDGRRVEKVFNGTLQRPAEIECSVPEEAIEGSVQAIVKIYPSSFSQLVEGLDAIFQRPYGCFEQTSSTTYPNVLALEYLRQTKTSLPEIEAKARQYIHLGYQRLLGFEVDGGGFDWFGRPPANVALSAYGLMEFVDMARVHDVDPSLIRRTREWLLSKRRVDGSWSAEGHQMHEDPTRAGRELAELSTTAYVAWAVFSGPDSAAGSQATLDYLLAHEPAAIDDPYVLALVCNALLAMDESGRAAQPYLQRLEQMEQSSDDGRLVWWEHAGARQTMFYGAGRSGSIETTALAALAMIKSGTSSQATRGALTWLIEQKDSRGTWHSTQATVLALRALLAGTGKPLGDDKRRLIDVAIDGQSVRELTVPADQGEVMQQLSLSEQLAKGRHRVTLAERSGTAAGYQVALSYYLPESYRPPLQQEPLSIDIAYECTELTVDETVAVRATLVNKMPITAPMVILDLPIPPGFMVDVAGLDRLAESGAIAKYQLTPRSVVVYLRELPPSEPLELRYRLRATMPVRVAVAPARAYEYYDPDRRVVSAGAELTVVARQ